MQVFKKVLNFYVNSSIHVALSVTSLTCITLLEFHKIWCKNILFFVFFASVTGYNFVKYFGLAKFHHRSLANLLKAIQIFSFLSFICMCYFALQLNDEALFYVFCFGVITFFYAIPFLPKTFFVDSKQNLRSVGGLKVYLIALVWTGVTVFLPLIDAEQTINADVIITGIQRFLFIIVLMLPFEIRDLQYDSLKLSTIPQKIGIKRTKLMGVWLLIVFFLLEMFKDEVFKNNGIIMFLISIITLLFLKFSRKKQGVYYSSFWVEAIPIIWLLLFVCFN